jgi:hypothetical protein
MLNHDLEDVRFDVRIAFADHADPGLAPGDAVRVDRPALQRADAQHLLRRRHRLARSDRPDLAADEGAAAQERIGDRPRRGEAAELGHLGTSKKAIS